MKKEIQNVTLSIRLPKEDLEYIKKEAAKREISIAQYVRQMCNPEKYGSEIAWQNKKLSQ